MREKDRSGVTAVAERRTEQRYPLQLQVDLRSPSGEAASAYDWQTCDISATGLYVRGDAGSLEEGSRVQLTVRLPVRADGGAVDLRGVGRVVRVDRAADPEVGVAVSFDQIQFSEDDLESIT